MSGLSSLCRAVGCGLAVLVVLLTSTCGAQVLNGYINPLWATERRPTSGGGRLGKTGGYMNDEPILYYDGSRSGRQSATHRQPTEQTGLRYYPLVQRPGYEYRVRVPGYEMAPLYANPYTTDSEPYYYTSIGYGRSPTPMNLQ